MHYERQNKRENGIRGEKEGVEEREEARGGRV